MIVLIFLLVLIRYFCYDVIKNDFGEIMKVVKYLLLIVIFNIFLYAQDNVGIGTTNPDASAILELQSTEKGFLVPRMTTAERNAISSPLKGLIVYDTDLELFYFNAGTSGSPDWVPILSDEVDLTSQVTGVLPVANGGTGSSGITGVIKGDGSSYSGLTANSGELTYWSDANTIAGLTDVTWSANTLTVTGDLDATGLIADDLLLNPLGSAPSSPSEGQLYYDDNDDLVKFYDGISWIDLSSGTVDLTTDVTGVLPVANGGTGASSLSSGIVKANGTNPLTTVSSVQNRVTIWTSNNDIGGYSGLTWDNSDESLSVGGFVETGEVVYLPGNQPGTAYEGMVYYDQTDDELKVYDGSAWNSIGGGGGGTPGGNDGNVQFNNSGSFDGTDNLYWSTADNSLGINTNAPDYDLDVAGTIYGNSFISGEDGQDGQLTIYSEQGVTDYNVTFSPNAAMTGDSDYILPPDDGPDGKNSFLMSDGAGNMTWDTTSFWSTSGNIVSAEPILGTSNYWGISFETNNQERMKILASGVVRFFNNSPELMEGIGLKFYEPDNNQFTEFKAQNQSVDINYNLPAAQGSADQVLTNDGSGNLSWESPLPSATNQGETVYYDSTNSQWSATDNMKIYDDAIQMNQAMALAPENVTISSNYNISNPSNSSYWIFDISSDAIYTLTINDADYIGQILFIQLKTGQRLVINDGGNIELIDGKTSIALECDSYILFIWDGSKWYELVSNELDC